MGEKQELLEWVQAVKWDKHIYDKEVQVLLSQLKDRIEKLGGSGDGASGGDGKSHRVKLVAVGDGAVGKTSLLISFAKGKFPTDYVPTVFENYTTQMKRDADGSTILLHLWDTAGQEDYDRLRPLSYPGADIVLLCFSTVTQSSLESVKEKWSPEINHYVPDVPYFLVGTKIDLRDDKKPDPSTGEFEPVSKEEGEAMRKSIKATKYIEISSKNRTNLDDLFKQAVETVLELRLQHEGDASNIHGDDSAPLPRKSKGRSGGCTLL